MNATVQHRGPDGDGVLIVDRVAFGHTRLSIIDLTEAGAQPKSRGKRHITFNGEIYNFRELRAQLAALGEHFTTESDTEVLLAALAVWGLGALDRLRGMFAFAYFDEAEQAVYFVRDPFGKKPLVFLRTSKLFCAASESKQIFKALSEGPSVDIEVALRFLDDAALNVDDSTFFESVRNIPAGCYGRLDVGSGEFEITHWYDLSARVTQQRSSREEAVSRTRELLLEAVRRRHVADVPVGIGLSGGIDSSATVCLSAALDRDTPLRTITTYSPVNGYDERRFSRAVTEKFAIEPIEVEPEFDRIWSPELLCEVGYFNDQPILSGSFLNEYRLFEAARDNGLIVMLGGQGADEYFGGYGEFWYAAQLDYIRSGRVTDFLRGFEARAEALGVPRSMVVRRFVASFIGNPQRKARVDGWRRVPRGPRMKRPTSTGYNALSIHELLTSSIPHQVHSQDRSSMRWSIEARLPFLDIDLVEYVLGLPTEMKCDRGVQKSLLRKAVPELPAVIANRLDKIGFASPDAESVFRHSERIRSDLREATHRLNRILNPEIVLSAFDEMTRQRKWYDGFFYRVMAFDGWMRAFDRTL